MKIRLGASSVVAFAVWVVGAGTMLGGCRGVLGIEDLDVVADGGGDATRADAKVDSPFDASVTDTSTADVTVPNKCAVDADCPKCCHDDPALRPAFARLGQYAKATSCICGTAPCSSTAECGADICTGSTGAPAGGCLQCVDMQIRPAAGTSQCANAKTQCNGDSSCKPFLDCITSCK